MSYLLSCVCYIGLQEVQSEVIPFSARSRWHMSVLKMAVATLHFQTIPVMGPLQSSLMYIHFKGKGQLIQNQA